MLSILRNIWFLLPIWTKLLSSFWALTALIRQALVGENPGCTEAWSICSRIKSQPMCPAPIKFPVGEPVNSGASCDKPLISVCNASAVQLTSTLISHELQPLLWFIKQISHTSQALIYLLLLFKCSEREKLEDVIHPFPSPADLQGNGLHTLPWVTNQGQLNSEAYKELMVLYPSNRKDLGLPDATVVKNPPANAGDMGSIPGQGSFQPRDWAWVSYIAGRCFTIWATRDWRRRLCQLNHLSHLSWKDSIILFRYLF